MIKTLGISLWAALVGLGASYAAATFSESTGSGATTAAVVAKGPIPNGLEYKKPPPLTVPMISDGRLRGYVVARIVFTADARALSEFPIDPTTFVLDEAFRRIYTDGKVEFDKMSKYNLDDLTKAIKTNVNQRLGAELIHDVLLEDVNYVDKNGLKEPGGAPAN